MRKQVVVIHGGNMFRTYGEYLSYLKKYKIDFGWMGRRGWKESLSSELGRGFEVIFPQMPNRRNARYFEWKIWFRKYLSYINKGVILVGHSLGGMFLVKYLSENKFPKKIKGVFLVATPHNDKDSREFIADFVLSKSLKRLENQGGEVFLYYSKDDKIVPFADLAKYKKALPNAHARVFKNRGHFNQAQFPELVRDIKDLFR